MAGRELEIHSGARPVFNISTARRWHPFILRIVGVPKVSVVGILILSR
jgi:hypothetical protein